MKKALTILVLVLFLLSIAGMAVAGSKVVGKVKSLVIVVADEKSGAKKKVNCGKGCKIKKRTNIKPGTKVTIESKGKKTVIRKAVAGC